MGTKKNELVMQPLGISPWAYEKTVQYLYSSDEQRKGLISSLEKSLVLDMAKLAHYWQIEKLQAECDEELCNSMGELNLSKEDLSDWLAQAEYTPKFSALFGFAARIAGEGALQPIIEQMQTSAGAVHLAAKCTPEEIALFSTLKTEFGLACLVPPGTFGKEEWEGAFPVTIAEVPPLPPGIHAILEENDPYEPGKKLKDTCQLFLRPQKVIFHEEGGATELLLNFNGVKKLAENASDESRRFGIHEIPLDVLNDMPVADPGWVLMRKEVIPESMNRGFDTPAQRFERLKGLLKGNFEVPKWMDAVLLNTLTYVSEGKCLYGHEPLIFRLCQEQALNFQISVGGFQPNDDEFNEFAAPRGEVFSVFGPLPSLGLSGLLVLPIPEDSQAQCLSGSWKF